MYYYDKKLRSEIKIMNMSNENERPVRRADKRYDYKGQIIPSVTAVLSAIEINQSLCEWYAKVTAQALIDRIVPRTEKGRRDYKSIGLSSYSVKELSKDARQETHRQRDAAASIGSRVHDLIYFHADVADSTDNGYVHTAHQSYKKWCEDMGGFKFVKQEVPLVGETSDGFLYAGTPDAIIEVDGRRIVVDWKTSAQIRTNHALQVAAYAKAWNASDAASVDEAWVLRLSKHYEGYEHKVVDIDTAYALFEKYLYIYEMQGGCWKDVQGIVEGGMQ